MPFASPDVSDDQAALLDHLLSEAGPSSTVDDWGVRPPADLGASLWLGLAARAVPPPGYDSDSDTDDDTEAILADTSPEAVEAVSNLDQALASQFPEPSAAQGVRHSVRSVLETGSADMAAAELAELLGFDHLELASSLVLNAPEVVRLLDPIPPPVPLVGVRLPRHSYFACHFIVLTCTCLFC